jgi:hypothetical protein
MPFIQSDALTTLESLKEFLNVTGTDQDGKLERVINRVTWWIEDTTRRKFNNGTRGGLKARRYNGDTGSAPNNVHTTTKVRDEDYIYFDGTTKDKGGHTLINCDTGLAEFHLPAYPVQADSVLTFALAVLSNRTNSGGETWDTTSLLQNDAYVLDRENGILRLLSGTFTPGTRNYRITCAAGYQYGDNQPYVPPDLEGVCLELCKQVYRDDRAVLSESIGSWSRQYSGDLKKADPYVMGVLAKYTRFSL